ncbi:MAG: thiamine pyrophosphate-dependent dehydrogenase E1 component subunit alpha [Thermodesulfobacteriota bacterium]
MRTSSEAPGAPSPEQLFALYRTMLCIRLFEERIVELYPEQEMRCPVHLCIGQEATAAGVCAHLTDADLIFGTHRSHGHCIAKGMSLGALAAELYGRVTGCAGGFGGSMHLVDPAHGMPGTTAIVGGTLPLAVGAALAFALRREERVAVAFFGDGAVDEGVFHEALNFASLKRLPVVFACENNFYATNSFQGARQPAVAIADRAAGYAMPGVAADGNDAAAVYRAAGDAVHRARRGGGPTLLELRTYRWKGHVGPTCDVEAGCRPAGEVAAWLERCPVAALRARLAGEPGGEARLEPLAAELRAEVEEAFRFAQASPLPTPDRLFAPLA